MCYFVWQRVSDVSVPGKKSFHPSPLPLVHADRDFFPHARGSGRPFYRRPDDPAGGSQLALCPLRTRSAPLDSIYKIFKRRPLLRPWPLDCLPRKECQPSHSRRISDLGPDRAAGSDFSDPLRSDARDVGRFKTVPLARWSGNGPVHPRRLSPQFYFCQPSPVHFQRETPLAPRRPLGDFCPYDPPEHRPRRSPHRFYRPTHPLGSRME
jgi:hypothetical protein